MLSFSALKIQSEISESMIVVEVASGSCGAWGVDLGSAEEEEEEEEGGEEEGGEEEEEAEEAEEADAEADTKASESPSKVCSINDMPANLTCLSSEEIAP